MKIAVLERFADSSRRCDPNAIGGPEDEVTCWDLTTQDESQSHKLSKILYLLRQEGSLSIGDRIKLFTACIRTGGTSFGAVAPQGVELLKRVRAGEIERITCFSAKDFALVEMLARETGTPCLELLSRQTQYFGEFGFELLAVLPYAYWLHLNGRLERTVGGLDTRCLYYFSANHEERPIKRHYVPITEYPVGERGWRFRYDRAAFPKALDTRRWSPPPYSEFFRDERFGWQRKICIVSNKVSDEQFAYQPMGPPSNFMGKELLLQLIGMLRDRYQVIYNRPRASDIATDHQTIHETGDIETVKHAFPDVATIQELHASYPTLSFNELQLRLYSGCQHFISVLGGSAFLASYFGGINIVLARQGWEVDCGAYERWFDRFSGARVVAVDSDGELLRTVEREFL